jgi:hypothetical protein
MPIPANILSAVTRPGAIIFPENREAVQALTRGTENLVASPHPSGTVWHPPGTPPASGPRALVTTTGHGIIFGDHGLRILYLDPGGTPLHECAWASSAPGPPCLLRARLQLDWGQWVGIVPEGLVNAASFDISKKPGWQRLTTDDLQGMAAQALGVTPEEVAFFYDDKSLSLDSQGRVTIRHRKDAFYILEDGTFARSRFMACMGAMHWGQIDFLPVVELFQSLLAGTGSAAFELIRGLYDDQNEGASVRSLRYRGIPTYPSPQAFQLFSTYFQPEAPGGADPFRLFMDPTRSSQVTWRPRPECPRRYMDRELGLCVTVTGGAVHKVTRRNDAAALPYTRPRKDGLAPGDRMAGTTGAALQLRDGDRGEDLPLRPEWGVTQATPLPGRSSSSILTWRTLFADGTPALDAKRAYFAVPLYPEDETMVDDVGTLALVEEQASVHLERLAGSQKASGSKAVLLHDWDAVLAECVDLEKDRDYTVLYTRPEFAQRQAQRLWDRAAATGDLARLHRVVFLQADRHQESAYARSYGLLYGWILFEQYGQRAECERRVSTIAKALASGGIAVLVGPAWMKEALARVSLRVRVADPVAETMGVRMHRTLLPKARVHPEATLFLAEKA